MISPPGAAELVTKGTPRTMTTQTPPTAPPPQKLLGVIPTRSLGLKFVMVCFLALLMMIPGIFVQEIVRERSQRAQSVAAEIGAVRGGPQLVSGPILAVPYVRTVAVQEQVQQTDGTQRAVTRQQFERGQYLIFASTGTASAQLATEVLRRSIYKVPVYQATTALKASFDIAPALEQAPAGMTFDWASARVIMLVSDLRGVKSETPLQTPAGPKPFAPWSDPSISVADPGMAAAAAPDGRPMGAVQVIAASAGDFARPDARFDVSVDLVLSGVDRFAVSAFAQDTTATINGAWGSPKFEGAFLPETREVGAEAFTSSWRATFLARGLPRAGVSGAEVSLSSLGAKDFAVTLIQRSEVYTGVERATRYALLFIGTVFLAYFLFEAMGGGRAHPAQYLLVGLAQCVFYLLLLSFAEQIGFDLAFLIAAAPTVILSAAYAAGVFKSRTRGLWALLVFGLVYAAMYVLMTLEDQALLAGSIAAFAAIAAVMWLTRNLNWYGDKDAGAPQPNG